MKLPDNEIRDITKLLEEGKPLPDKCRFQLFGDDREIQLVWNGKPNEVEKSRSHFTSPIMMIDIANTKSPSNAASN